MNRTRWPWLMLAAACLVSVGWGVSHRRPGITAVPSGPPHLVVLNGTGRAGLARRVSLALAAAGMVVDRVGNAPHDHFRRSLLLWNRLSPQAARSLGKRLGNVTVLPGVDPRAGEDAVLVLGGDADRVIRALAATGAHPVTE